MANSFCILRDARLLGNLGWVYAPYTFTVGATTPLASAFQQISTRVSLSGKLHTLFILCHGIQRQGFLSGHSRKWFYGGFGLSLGRENVLPSNVGNWRSIRDRVNNIVVYACGAGDTEPGDQGGPADGQALMRALARNTNACVFAADETQVYDSASCNFGKWEGQVFCFTPSGLTFGGLPPRELVEIFD